MSGDLYVEWMSGVRASAADRARGGSAAVFGGVGRAMTRATTAFHHRKNRNLGNLRRRKSGYIKM
jgi:hypothetical protein